MDPFSAHILADARRQDYLREAEKSRLARAVREQADNVNPEASHEHGQGGELESGFRESQHHELEHSQG